LRKERAASAVAAALASYEAERDEHLRALMGLCRIPSVSAEGFPASDLRRAATATAELLRRSGLEHVRIVTLRGVAPYVCADWLKRPGAPTLLVYGHYDVQPPGRPELWQSPPYAPAVRGGRLYGRGTVDDKGGFTAHLAALASWLRAHGSLPINVRVLIEGEEETGSAHLPAFLERHGALLAADALLLSDTANPATGVPALTYSLRGICQIDVEVRGLEHPQHSGMWGGPVPDTTQILCQMIAGLVKKDGSLDVPGLYRDVARLSPRQRARLRAARIPETVFKRDARMLPGMTLAGARGRYSVAERLWTRPALTVIALESHPVKGSSNQIVDVTRARLSLRTVPFMDERRAGERIIAHLTRRPPFGARVRAAIVGQAPWWRCEPEGPVFDAARRALAAGFGHRPSLIGSGGTIGFVRPLVEALGNVPCLLVGVMDPPCAVHAENESLHLGDWSRITRSTIHILDELSRLPREAFARRRKRS
jgi:acetylornithine deacetylase/succinyl-diaminopimelate desuccinylase-like protein